MLVIGVLPMSITAWIALENATASISKGVFHRLEAVRQLKGDAVKKHFRESEKLIASFSNLPGVVAAASDLKQAYRNYLNELQLSPQDVRLMRSALGQFYSEQFGAKYQQENQRSIDTNALLTSISDTAAALQYQYIQTNPEPLGNKDALYQTNDGSSYDQFHIRYHDLFKQLLQNYGYYDIFLVDPGTGEVFYSVFKELDFATSLYSGPYANSNFAKVVQQTSQDGQIHTFDFTTYTPSYEAPASFQAAPIKKNGRIIALLVFQLPIEPINEIMTSRTGMGETGETYLVGEDLLMRSDSHLAPEIHSVSASFANPNTGKIDTQASREALQGKSGTQAIMDYNNNPVLSSYTRLELPDFNWAILAEIDQAEAYASITQLNQRMLIVGGVALVLILLFSYLLSTNISKPITALAKLISYVKDKGDFSKRTNNANKDEVGQISQALDSLLGSLESSAAETQNALQQAEASRQTADEQAAQAKTIAAEAQQQALEATRIKRALDSCQASVMLADTSYTLIYLNDSVNKLLQHRLRALQSDIPALSNSELLGRKLDEFVNDTHALHEILDNLTSSHKQRLEIGGITFDVTASPVYAENGSRIGTSIEWLDLTDELLKQAQERKIASNNARIRQTLDACSANVMLVGSLGTIAYVNEATISMFAARQHSIAKKITGFDAAKIEQSKIDMFNQHPLLATQALQGVTQSCNDEFKLGDLTFALTITPVFDAQKQRLGTAIEWRDLTDELAARVEEQRIAAENATIRQALDVCQANVMLTNADAKVIYLNNSIQQLLQGREDALRQANSQFAAEQVIGQPAELFMPTSQQDALLNGEQAEQVQSKVAGLTFDISATPVTNQAGKRIGTVVEWQDMTDILAQQAKERAIAQQNAQIRQALDNSSTSTLIANAKDQIIYANQAMQRQAQDLQNGISKTLPGFSANNMTAFNLSQLNQAMGENHSFSQDNQLYQNELTLEQHTLAITANPIIDQTNSRIGTVVEWQDRTTEVAVEQEIDQIVSAASNGDLGQRVNPENKQGFFAALATSLNQLLTVCEGVSNDTGKMLESLAKGDLSHRIEQDYQGSFGKLKQDANATADKLTQIIQQISKAADEVTSGASDIATGNVELSRRIEMQASSLEETAASMSQITESVQSSANSAGDANSVSKQASNQASAGGQVVEQAVSSMQDISAASNKIADIIGVIDEIAFQTNLLALNAAVEAARAGEQGRGFAVVASEVRSLAQRSATSAREIKELIDDSVEKVRGGTELVNRSGETLQEIVDTVGKVSTMVAQIAESAAEQGGSIGQVNQAVTNMEQMTQQNAAVIEQATAASQSMADQAHNMKSLMAFFKL